MSVAAIGAYQFPARDAVEKFVAPLLYIGWEDHLMFCAPVCLPVPSFLAFGDFIRQVLPGIYGEHPDFAKVDWARAEWSRSGRAWIPDHRASMRANGLTHKSVIRFRTPGLTGLAGSCS